MELLVVMGLMAIVLAMTTPLFTKSIASVRLQVDARNLASILKLARQEAITTGQGTIVVFYPDNAKYKMMGQGSHNLQPGTAFVGDTTFNSRVGGLPACGFSPSGAPSSGGTITLGNSDQRLYVIVNPAAGRIRISEIPPIGW